jgi:NodT family efflux transporter outer membrane factor (OMF) lipoprotein
MHQRYSTSLVCLGVAALLSACSSDGGLRPQARLDDGARLSATAVLDGMTFSAVSWPDDQWWNRYGDAQLGGLIAEALDGNPGLRLADARVRQAAAVAGIAESTLAPQVTGSARVLRQHYSENSVLPPKLAGRWATTADTGVNVSYELDFWGKNQASVAAAVGRRHAAEVEAEASRLMLTVSICQAYVRLSQLYAQRDLAEAVLRQRRQILALTDSRVRAQLDSALELKQAQQAIPEALGNLAALDETLALAGQQLAALMGAGPDRALSIMRPRLSTGAPAGVPTQLPSELIARRPDVVAQRWRVEALRQDIKVAHTQFYPSVNLSALVGLQSLGLGNLLLGGSSMVGAAPGLSLPLFDGGRLRSNLALRDAEYDIAVEQYNQVLVDAVRDVVGQLSSLHALTRRATLQREARDTAREAHTLSLQRYRAGLGNYLQVLSTETQLLAQERLQVDLDTRAFELDIGLVRALGGGYSMPAIDSLATLTPSKARP